MKKTKGLALFIYLWAVFLLPGRVFPQTMHVFLVADTYADDIGQSCLTDFNNMSIQVTSIAQSCKFDLQIYPLKGGQFKREAVLASLQELSCQRDDVVFFYYSGHGVKHEGGGQWPNMVVAKDGEKTRDSFLHLEEVDRMIAQKGARFRLMAADCCNNPIQTVQLASRGFVVVPSNNTEVNSLTVTDRFYRALFKDFRGKVMVTSSSPGEVSVCSSEEGGIFTNSWLQVFERMANPADPNKLVADWATVMKRAKDLTIAVYAGKQNPIYEISLGAAPSGPTKLGPVPSSEMVNPEIVGTNFSDRLSELANPSIASDRRLRMIPQVLSQYFAGPDVVAEKFGRDGSISLDAETAEMFLERLFASSGIGLVRIQELPGTTRNAQGKITKLLYHEVYQKP